MTKVIEIMGMPNSNLGKYASYVKELLTEANKSTALHKGGKEKYPLQRALLGLERFNEVSVEEVINTIFRTKKEFLITERGICDHFAFNIALRDYFLVHENYVVGKNGHYISCFDSFVRGVIMIGMPVEESIDHFQASCGLEEVPRIYSHINNPVFLEYLKNAYLKVGEMIINSKNSPPHLLLGSTERFEEQKQLIKGFMARNYKGVMQRKTA